MTHERWQQVESLFYDALEQSDSQREDWLRSVCANDEELRAEVISLLDNDRLASQSLLNGRVERAVRELGEEADPARDRRIGPYRLLRELGQGGMGTVYLAARADEQYDSEVAIKLVRPGLDTDFILQRFRRERQILARLEHPNIARLLDGGTTREGVPYIVMEYVAGPWITEYAEQQALTVEERLKIFLPVCAAVAYAHRNFIVHRDLKPGNILIDPQGTPKLLDFGISKLLVTNSELAGESGDRYMLTPDFASPEQILGEPITVASDIYSLGAVLYELLCGVRPHRIDALTPVGLERAICLDETIPPSVAVRGGNRVWQRQLAGDLDNIVLHAMQKSPERRYPTMDAFAADIRRHLEFRPIVARPDSLWYRTRRFVRRNRTSVALSAVTLLSLAAGAATASNQARIAQQRYQDVRELAATFVFDVDAAARDLPGSLPVRQLIAHTGLQYLDRLARSSARDWELKRELAAAYQRVGDIQGGGHAPNLGEPAAALVSYRNAEALLDAVLTHDPANLGATVDRITLLARIGDLHLSTGQPQAAIENYRRSLQRIDEIAPGRGGAALDLKAAGYSLSLARALRLTGNTTASREALNHGLALARQVSAVRPDERDAQLTLALGYAQLAGVLADQGERETAQRNYRAAAAALEEVCRRYPLDTRAHRELAVAYGRVGDTTLGSPTAAREWYGRAVAQWGQVVATQPGLAGTYQQEMDALIAKQQALSAGRTRRP